MRNGSKPQESKKIAAKNEEKPAAVEATPGNELNPVVKAKADIKSTYQTHIEAQKDFENACKELEKQDQEAYQLFEAKYQAYEEAISIAFKTRETAEKEALAAYRKITDKAGSDYREAMNHALLNCKHATEEARKALFGISGKEPGPVYQRRASQSLPQAARTSLNTAKTKVTSWFTNTKTYLSNPNPENSVKETEH
jgi:hypothetical protein